MKTNGIVEVYSLLEGLATEFNLGWIHLKTTPMDECDLSFYIRKKDVQDTTVASDIVRGICEKIRSEGPAFVQDVVGNRRSFGLKLSARPHHDPDYEEDPDDYEAVVLPSRRPRESTANYRKRVGLCRHCGGTPKADRALCQPCADKQAARSAKQRRASKKKKEKF